MLKLQGGGGGALPKLLAYTKSDFWLDLVFRSYYTFELYFMEYRFLSWQLVMDRFLFHFRYDVFFFKYRLLLVDSKTISFNNFSSLFSKGLSVRKLATQREVDDNVQKFKAGNYETIPDPKKLQHFK